MRVFSWGILGTGRIAQDFSNALRYSDKARLLAVASRDGERAKAFAARVGAKYAFGNYAELLDMAELDIVYIATPNHRHRDDCLQAIAARKAVLCEKPLGMNATEARAIAEAAQKAAVFCMEGLWTHFMPSVVESERLLKNGSLGKAIFLSGSFGEPTTFSAENRFFDPGMGGGALLDRGCYPISLALRFLGKVESVSGVCEYAETGVDATAAGIIKFSGGALAVIGASLLAYQANNLVISGTKGRLVLQESITQPQMLSLVLREPVDVSRKRPRIDHAKAFVRGLLGTRNSLRVSNFLARDRSRYFGYKGNGYVHEIDEVHRCLLSGVTESSIVPLSLSIGTLEVIDAIRQSAAAPRDGCAAQGPASGRVS
jgi:predicted dehydrogenase